LVSRFYGAACDEPMLEAPMNLLALDIAAGQAPPGARGAGSYAS